MIPTDAEIIERLTRVLPSRSTVKAALPVVKALILGAWIGALKVVLSAPDVTLRSTLELELNHYRCELAALKEKG